MTTLNTKNFTTLVSQWAAVVQSSVASAKPSLVLGFTKGTILRALAEAQASVSLWLQGLILKLLTATRLSTSEDDDVDTFIEDYGLERMKAAASSGVVTFARVNPVNPATVPVGAIVQTSDGSQTFTVTADSTNSAWSASANGGAGGYIIPAEVASLDFPVVNTVPGLAGNVQAAVITILQTGISGVDSVTNAAPFTNGFDKESDSAAKARFVNFINSLAKATEGAIGYAIQSTIQGLQYQVWEPGVGGFTELTVYIDDGTGAVPDSKFAPAAANAQSVRAAGVPMAVFKATKATANVTMVISTATGYDHPTVVAQVIASLALYINGIGLQPTNALGTLSYLKLSQIAFNASAGVTDITTYTLNGGTADLVPAAGQVIKTGSIIVS